MSYYITEHRCCSYVLTSNIYSFCFTGSSFFVIRKLRPRTFVFVDQNLGLRSLFLRIFIFWWLMYVPVKSKLQHPPPGQPPRHLNFFKILFKFPPHWAEKPFKCSYPRENYQITSGTLFTFWSHCLLGGIQDPTHKC